MADKNFFFAGGGTGGHIYPAIAVAEQILKLQPDAKIRFFCSTRNIDTQILAKTGFEYTALPARGFSLSPTKLLSFFASFLRSYKIAGQAISENKDTVVIGVGGFVAAPVCLAAHKKKIPIILLNIDIVPGRANKLIARWADQIFVQFEDTRQYFASYSEKVSVVGCPLRSGFDNPWPQRAIEQLGLNKNKKILFITGASSGAENINTAVCSLLKRLEAFAGNWQIVHLAGTANYEKVKTGYAGAKITHKVLGYFDDMPDLLSAADLVVGRSGAVSAAEYAAAAVPSICIPYPYHKDRHQYLHARKLAEAGAAVIVDDLPDGKQTANQLWEKLNNLMSNDKKRRQMAESCKAIAKLDASYKIAQKLLQN
jgi:UDP-N-acetylglucosamine--N-acetylmuramyl-(pentapeptide) pyrophosphoryl-undecaprenol N-acetylglucosamine transferase